VTPEWLRWALGLFATPFLGFVWWVILSVQRNKNEIDELKLHVAENYAKNGAMQEVFMELRKLSRVVFEIAGKLNVPIRTD
jgi:hypothetical protein